MIQGINATKHGASHKNNRTTSQHKKMDPEWQSTSPVAVVLCTALGCILIWIVWVAHMRTNTLQPLSSFRSSCSKLRALQRHCDAGGQSTFIPVGKAWIWTRNPLVTSLRSLWLPQCKETTLFNVCVCVRVPVYVVHVFEHAWTCPSVRASDWRSYHHVLYVIKVGAVRSECTLF